MKLPKRALTNVDLIKYAKKFKIYNFRGVFMRDEIIGKTGNFRPRRPYKNECAIINLDSSRGEGSHWTAYVKRGVRVVYFDSFGDLPPPRELQEYLRDCVIQYNHKQIQNYNTVNCGHLCIKFLLDNNKRN